MISIIDLRDKYGIKQSTAYKWKSYLRDNGYEETYANYDKISRRELNLSGIVKIEDTFVQETSPVMNDNDSADSGFGLTVGRLHELNAEAELEVLVKSKLKDYHESKLQGRRSEELRSKISEVQSIDPKKLGSILQGFGVA